MLLINALFILFMQSLKLYIQPLFILNPTKSPTKQENLNF